MCPSRITCDFLCFVLFIRFILFYFYFYSGTMYSFTCARHQSAAHLSAPGCVDVCVCVRMLFYAVALMSCRISHCQSNARKIKWTKSEYIFAGRKKERAKQKTKFQIRNECTHRFIHEWVSYEWVREMIWNSNILTNAKEITSQFASFQASASSLRCHPKMFQHKMFGSDFNRFIVGLCSPCASHRVSAMI